MNNFRPQVIIVAIIAVFLLLGANMSFVTLKPGQRGVIFRKFSSGLDKENVFKPGFYVIAPWNELFVYSVLEQTSEEALDVLDKNGLSIVVDISVRFNPIKEQIGFIHEQFGVNYINRIVIPEVRSTVRRVAGRFTAEEIYSTKRAELEDAIIQETKLVLNENNIEMQALLIRSIILPDQIKTAIESKLKQEQEALAYQFRLSKETSEAERKRIEAEGIAKFNEIINSSLTDKIIQQRGIEATIELSTSPNSKVVVIGSGSDGLPLILGNQ